MRRISYRTAVSSSSSDQDSSTVRVGPGGGAFAGKWPRYRQADEPAGQGGGYAGRLADEAAGALLAPDSGAQDGERDHDSEERDKGQADQRGSHSQKGATQGADAVTAWVDGFKTS